MKLQLTLTAVILLAAALPCCAQPVEVPEQSLKLFIDTKPVARTVVTPFDKASAEQTYKVFTHLMDPATGVDITKGAGGKFPHHRGLFIGWNHTHVGDRQHDTWHMKDCHQVFSQEMHYAAPEGRTGHKIEVMWNKPTRKPFIREERTIDAFMRDGVYLVDFSSRLESIEEKIAFRGDLQHAGMQVRLADEVSTHEESTEYILPEGAVTGEDDAVTGAWWACCSAEVAGKRYWVLHMTPPSNPGGVPVYSIRKYARFGAFFEPDLEPGKPLSLHFRVAWSDQPLDRATCQKLYDAFAAERP